MTSQRKSCNQHNDSIVVDKPFLNTDDAAKLFIRLYGMPKPTTVEQLVSYSGQNFFLKVDGFNADGYVLKLLDAVQSREVDGFFAVNSVQKYLKQHGFMCAAPMQNVNGADLALEEFTKINSEGEKVYGRFIVRAYPFIPGISFADVLPANASHLLYEAGKCLAQMHLCLQKYPYHVEALSKIWERARWNILNTHYLTDVLHVVDDEKKRQLVLDVVYAIEKEVRPMTNKMRSGIVHGDFSHTNLLVLPEVNNKTNYKLCGIIDFDGCCYKCIVFDVATAMMYLSVSKAAGDQPLLASGAFLAGYQSVNPLTELELEVLHICQAARYVQSLVFGLHMHTLQPDNAYLLDTQCCWPIFERFWRMETEERKQTWQNAAKFVEG